MSAHAGVRDVGVGKGLQRLVDRLGVNPLVGLGVVLDLDGQGAADGLDEDLALDGDVWVAAEDVVLTGRLRPCEVVGRREDVVALAARVQERRRAVVGQGPAQHADVAGLLAGLEDGQQLAFDMA